MKYGVSEMARLLRVDREIVQTWSYVFSEYLGSEANPGKGKVRQFITNDIRVLAYISMYWENKPDIENIKLGLNSGSHLDNDNIDDLITSVTPLFKTMPSEIDENWGGVAFGGEFGFADIFENANSFKLAGDILIENAQQNYEERELFQPAMFNYRHATELYIKAIIGEEINHDLQDLTKKLKKILMSELNAALPMWFENIIEAFHYSDPQSTTFRYGKNFHEDESFADMGHIKTLMDWMSEAFRRIRIELLRKERII